MHVPQSAGQVKQSSLGAWHVPSPQDWQVPQSGAQLSQVSSPLQ
jgi:hypothetical protein